MNYYKTISNTAIGLSIPTTDKEDILYTAITEGQVSIMDFPYLSGFRTRISELKASGIAFDTVFKEKTNRFGRGYRYAVHYILRENTDLSIKYYKKISTNGSD